MKNVILGILAVFLLLCIFGPFPMKRQSSETVGDSILSADLVGSGSDGLVLIKFGATWCPPCRMVDRELTKLGNGSVPVTIHKIDVDERPDLADQYRVSSIPRILLFQDGREIGDLVGYRSVSELTDWIRQSASTDSLAASENFEPAAVQGNPYVD